MSSKDSILANIKRNIKQRFDMPAEIEGAIEYPDKIAQFVDISKAVGGKAVVLKDGEDLNEVIRALYPDEKVIVSNLPEITIATRNPDDVEKPQDLNGTDLAIITGELGVAENGAIWIPQNVKEKVLYFITEYLVIILDKNKIVNNMHEAYKLIEFNDYGFGTFISGPSKTADIEQAMVFGAQAARGVTVILR